VLRYKETEDIDARFSEVERIVTAWRARIATANPVARTEFNNRLRISLIHHDAALEGEVLSYSEIKAAVDPTIISDPSLIPSYDEIRRFDDACNFANEQAANKKKRRRRAAVAGAAGAGAARRNRAGRNNRAKNGGSDSLGWSDWLAIGLLVLAPFAAVALLLYITDLRRRPRAPSRSKRRRSLVITPHKS